MAAVPDPPGREQSRGAADAASNRGGYSMANTSDPASGTSSGAKPAAHGVKPADKRGDVVATPGGSPLPSGSSNVTNAGPASAISAEAASPAHPWRKRLLLLLVLIGLAYGAYSLIPFVQTAMNTISTDDAYVNGHVTFVAPRVSGQVSRVLVDDNYRVKKGALLVQLDKEPYADQVAVKKAGAGGGRGGSGGCPGPVSRTGGPRRGFDARWLIAAGLLIMASGNYWMALMNLYISPDIVIWPRVVLIVGLSMVFVSINVAAFKYIPPHLRGAAVGLFALLRNEGGSVGTSLAQALQWRRDSFHEARVGEFLDPLNPAVTSFLEQGRAFFSPGDRRPGRVATDEFTDAGKPARAASGFASLLRQLLALRGPRVCPGPTCFAHERSVAEKGEHIGAE